MSNHDKPGDGQFEGRTFLYIRTHPADDGTEPLPAGLPFWISPDITIIQQPSGVRGDEAIANQMNQVEVIVTNAGGINAVDAYVEAFVADPSTAFTPATATRIGGDFLAIPSYNTATITFPWTPLPAQAGHRCLLARVCLTIPPDCYVNSSIFDVVGDRHVAQRNIHVVNLTKGGEKLSFGFRIVNPQRRRGEFLVRATELRIGKKADLVRAALRCRFAQFAEAPLKAVLLTVGEPVVPPDVSVPEGDLGVSPSGVLSRAVESKGNRSDRVKMNRGEVRHAVLTMIRNPIVRPGDIHVVQVEQIDTKTERVVGGLWLIAQQ